MATPTLEKPIKTIPYITGGLPFFGSLFEYQKDRLSLFERMVRECGDVAAMHFGPFSLTLFNTSEYVHSIMVEHAYDFDKGDKLHNSFRPIVGNGLFSSEGDFHRRQRKLMAPPFQPRHIMSYADTMVQYGEQMQQHWANGDVIDISQQMTHLTMSIVGKTLFDADVFTETDELGEAMVIVLNHVSKDLASLFPIPLDWPTAHNKRTKEAMTTLRSRIQRMVDERRASKQERTDFLSVLLQARDEDGNSMSDEQLRDEAMTLFGAGHETTATALTWAWYLLANHPDVYQKMIHEIDTVLQGRTPAYADLPRLPYTLQVFKETMRLYPPAYAVARVALHDVIIGDYLIPQQNVIFVSPYTLHRRPDYFPEPEVFNPDRFTPERERQLPRYAYLPFGAGPRICIGNHFAMMEGHLLLATLTQHMTVELVPGQNIEPDPVNSLTIRPKFGLKVVVKRRD